MIAVANLRALALIAALTMLAGAAWAQTPAAGITAPTNGASEVKPYEVEGFRSAKFGMDEAAVKRAIVADFSIKESTISKEVNPIDRTTVLSITAKEVLPEIAIARVHYILGYKDKKLFQVFVQQLLLPNAKSPNLGMPNAVQLNKALTVEIQNVLQGKKAVKPALDDAAAEWNKVLAQYQK